MTRNIIVIDVKLLSLWRLVRELFAAHRRDPLLNAHGVIYDLHIAATVVMMGVRAGRRRVVLDDDGRLLGYHDEGCLT